MKLLIYDNQLILTNSSEKRDIGSLIKEVIIPFKWTYLQEQIGEIYYIIHIEDEEDKKVKCTFERYNDTAIKVIFPQEISFTSEIDIYIDFIWGILSICNYRCIVSYYIKG